jgi:hypothetical protein
MRDQGSRKDESVSGAMHRGEAAGTPGAPLPQTDAADTGVGDGGLERTEGRRAAGTDATSDELGTTSRPRRDPDEGNRGIAGGRAGGTGP